MVGKRLYAETFFLLYRFLEWRKSEEPLKEAKVFMLFPQTLALGVFIVVASEIGWLPKRRGAQELIGLIAFTCFGAMNWWLLRGNRAEELLARARGTPCTSAKIALLLIVSASSAIVVLGLIR